MLGRTGPVPQGLRGRSPSCRAASMAATPPSGGPFHRARSMKSGSATAAPTPDYLSGRPHVAPLSRKVPRPAGALSPTSTRRTVPTEWRPVGGGHGALVPASPYFRCPPRRQRLVALSRAASCQAAPGARKRRRRRAASRTCRAAPSSPVSFTSAGAGPHSRTGRGDRGGHACMLPRKPASLGAHCPVETACRRRRWIPGDHRTLRPKESSKTTRLRVDWRRSVREAGGPGSVSWRSLAPRPAQLELAVAADSRGDVVRGRTGGPLSLIGQGVQALLIEQDIKSRHSRRRPSSAAPAGRAGRRWPRPAG